VRPRRQTSKRNDQVVICRLWTSTKRLLIFSFAVDSRWPTLVDIEQVADCARTDLHALGRVRRRRLKTDPLAGPERPGRCDAGAMPITARGRCELGVPICTGVSSKPSTRRARKRFSPQSSSRAHSGGRQARSPSPPVAISLRSRSRDSSWRTSPTTIREGRNRTPSSPTGAAGSLPALEVRLAGLHRHHVGQRHPQVEVDLLHRSYRQSQRSRRAPMERSCACPILTARVKGKSSDPSSSNIASRQTVHGRTSCVEPLR
jgi:hypothetical protein